ncbi:MAG: peptide chain release factor N(5)-glutamine methyltransferase [Candidatus Sericytochromatia bacterium]|nr:peptide chain release factor N(5)-glutamine methyltransferase [Candidatus Sericytochromatia bacterium]
MTGLVTATLPPPDLGSALRLGSRRLRRLDLPSADLEASLLLGRATGLARLELILNTARAITAEEWTTYDRLLKRREAREPFQYLVGSQEFMSLDFAVDAAVLIPRPETEILVEAVLDLVEDAGTQESGPRVLDVGTGSGAILVTLANYVRVLEGTGVDCSLEALERARGNAERLGVADRLQFVQGDLLEPVVGGGRVFDYVVANLPYIPSVDIEGLEPEVRDHEPRMALDGGFDGLALIRRLVAEVEQVIKPGGWLALEVMAGQAPRVMDLLEGWPSVQVRHDLAGIERVVLARAAQA